MSSRQRRSMVGLCVAGLTLGHVIRANSQITVKEAVALNCPPPSPGEGLTTYFKITPFANVVESSSADVTDTSHVWVGLAVDSRLAPFIRIRRKSEFRSIGGINIVGQDETLPEVARAASVTCSPVQAVLSDFAGGKPGVVEVVLTTGTAEAPLGTFDFAVEPLYSGAFALGPIYTWLKDPQFGVVRSNSGNLIVSATGDDRPRVLYVLTYTPFIWGRRNLNARLPFLAKEHLNPLIGIVTNHIADNAIVGATYDLFYGAVYIATGVHAGRVQLINPATGIEEGTPAPAVDFQIPTIKAWRTNWFLGLTVDLRAAIALIQAATSGTTSSTH